MPQNIYQCEIFRVIIVQIVIFKVVTPCGLVDKCNFLEKHAARIFRFEAENGDSIFLLNFISTQCPNPEDNNLNNCIYLENLYILFGKLLRKHTQTFILKLCTY